MRYNTHFHISEECNKVIKLAKINELKELSLYSLYLSPIKMFGD